MTHSKAQHLMILFKIDFTSEMAEEKKITWEQIVKKNNSQVISA